MVREDKVRIPLEDDIWGIEGDWTGNLEKATGMDSDEPLFYVEYVPNVDPNKSFVSWLQSVIPLLEIPKHKTPEPIPDSQINRVNPNHAGSVDGVPAMKLHLGGKSNGESDWRERIGNKLEVEVRKLEQEKSRSESSALQEKARRHRVEQDKESDKDSKGRGRGYMTDEERRMMDYE